ncbi:hypothetical protein ACFY8K_02255 [Streptomyces misionensis]|uniref:hypothetical protein n=1 Tax=Streptomyces misionensis TaxID=67331 RepID=UPI00368E5C53
MTITTSAPPNWTAPPGGTLYSYGILADALKKVGATTDLRHESVYFAPSVSAVAIRDIDQHKDLCTNIDDLDPRESEVDEFICSSDTTTHTAVTQELGQWLLGPPLNQPQGRQTPPAGTTQPAWTLGGSRTISRSRDERQTRTIPPTAAARGVRPPRNQPSTSSRTATTRIRTRIRRPYHRAGNATRSPVSS